MGARFERVKRFESDESIRIPIRATKNSAGYDFSVAENTIVWPLDQEREAIRMAGAQTFIRKANESFTLNEIADIIKGADAKVALVPTGIKAKLDEGTYLELVLRSSCPLKYYLIMANSVGIIDSDYYSNPTSDGEIFFQLINLGPYPILLQKGDTIGQGIIKQYLTTEDDDACGERTGGFGSTSK